MFPIIKHVRTLELRNLITYKKLTVDCEYLDKVPQYMRVIADKRFNIADECAARHIFYQYHLENGVHLSSCQMMLKNFENCESSNIGGTSNKTNEDV